MIQIDMGVGRQLLPRVGVPQVPALFGFADLFVFCTIAGVAVNLIAVIVPAVLVSGLVFGVLEADLLVPHGREGVHIAPSLIREEQGIQSEGGEKASDDHLLVLAKERAGGWTGIWRARLVVHVKIRVVQLADEVGNVCGLRVGHGTSPPWVCLSCPCSLTASPHGAPLLCALYVVPLGVTGPPYKPERHLKNRISRRYQSRQRYRQGIFHRHPALFLSTRNVSVFPWCRT